MWRCSPLLCYRYCRFEQISSIIIEYRHKRSIPAAVVWADFEAAQEETAVMHENSGTAKVDYGAVEHHAAFGLGGGMDVQRYMQEGDPAAFWSVHSSHY